MRGIEIRTGAEKAEGGARLPFVTLLFLEAGVLGILLFLRSLDGVEYPVGIVLPAAAVFCWMIWYACSRCRDTSHRGWSACFLIATAAGCILAVYLWNDLVRVQIAHVLDSLRGEAGTEPMQITEAALLFAVALSLWLYAMECLLKRHAALYMLTTAMLLLAPFLNVHIHMEIIFLLLLFQLGFWTTRAMDRGRNGGGSLSGKGGTVVSLAAAAVLSAALLLVIFSSEDLYRPVYAIEGYMQRSYDNLSGEASKPITGGQISRGNRYPAGVPHLVVSASRQPAQNVYLRGFGGGEYIGGDWVRFSDEALFEKMVGELSWEQGYGTRVDNMYYNLFYLMNLYTLAEDRPRPVTLMIQHANNEYENVYVPYYNQRRYSWTDVGYTYQYYEEKDMHIDWENIAPEYRARGEMYRELQEVYRVHAGDVYTQVPTEHLPRLTALVEKNPMTDLDEITAFILYTLQSNATYTETPGWMAFNEDVVEYFLFERGSGFCEHFAAAATLMYRLYGIPARYATGYKIAPSAFEPQEGGSYLAVVSDESAHAWVEIFVEDYGWTPVEVTPADDAGEAFVRRIYRRVAAHIYEDLPWWKRWVFRFGRVFG